MAWCLPRELVNKFRRALLSHEIDPAKLADMESSERRTFLEKYVGKDNAQQVNAEFESKLLLKNQKAGYISWAKKVTGITPKVRQDLLSKIERMDKVLNPEEEKQFLADLAERRLGFGVTEEEAKNISDLSKTVRETRAKAKEDFTFPSEEERLAYGEAQVNLENYVNELKLQSRKVSFREEKLRAIGNLALEIPGTLKSIVASLDNSFFGRQGVKTLLDLRTSKIWIRDFVKSWSDIGRQLFAKGKWYKSGDDAAMALIKADIYSRPNALNGKYDAGHYGLKVFSEEAYPSSFPEKIPLLGRLFKASEVAYNGGALRMRADLADRLIARAEEHGVNTLDPKQAEGLGHLVSSLTGRGSLGKGEIVAKELNVIFFSVKMLKGNFDVLTAHAFDPKVQSVPFVKKEAAKNLLSIITTLAGIMTIAKLLDRDSVDPDPRSTNFGKIKIFGHWTDFSGGMLSLVTLASRLVPTYHNGEFGFWFKSSNGRWTKLGEPGYGKRTALDVAEDFLEGKFSPALGILRDVWKGQTFDGKPVTIGEILKQTSRPMSAQNFEQLMKDPASSILNVVGSMILDVLGFSVSTYSVTNEDWNMKTSKEMQQFKEKIGDKRFKEANDRYNKLYYDWFSRVGKSAEYKSLSDEAKASLITKAKEDIKQKIFDKYGFSYEKPETTPKEEIDKETIKNLLPENLNDQTSSLNKDKKFLALLKTIPPLLSKINPFKVPVASAHELPKFDPSGFKGESTINVPEPPARIKSLLNKYFSGDETRAAIVIFTESGNHPRALNINDNGSRDYGLFQINENTFHTLKAWSPAFFEARNINTLSDLYDPEKNVATAYALARFEERVGKKTWSDWNGWQDKKFDFRN